MRQQISIYLLALALTLIQCQTKNETSSIPYPQPLPKDQPIMFLPGIVSGDSLDFNACFSPDGKSYYFSRYDVHDIYVTSWDGAKWTDAAVTPFSESEYLDADPAFGPDGNLYFISTRPRNTVDTIPDFDIWFVQPLENGLWSAPENLTSINSDSSEFYVSFAGNGNLYFASSRAGGHGSFDIYHSTYADSKFNEPENMGTAINGVELEHDPFISKDENTLLFTSVNRSDGFGRGDIYISKRKNGAWSQAQNAGPVINTDKYEFCSYLSPDGKYFFFSSDGDVKWVNSDVVK